jgi:hypothetical protein
MRNVSALEDLIFGNRFLNKIKAEYAFFNNCREDFLIDFEKTFSYISTYLRHLQNSSN